MHHPLTEYTRYELIGFVESQAVGEQIRIMDLNTHPELNDLGPDFWLFDAGEPDQFAIIMRYQAGSVLGYERTTDVDWCRNQWDAVLAASISLAEYLTLR